MQENKNGCFFLNTVYVYLYTESSKVVAVIVDPWNV